MERKPQRQEHGSLFSVGKKVIPMEHSMQPCSANLAPRCPKCETRMECLVDYLWLGNAFAGMERGEIANLFET